MRAISNNSTCPIRGTAGAASSGACTNLEVRSFYLARVAVVPERDKAWVTQGLTLEQRARRAFGIRHRARLDARALMADRSEVEDLRSRDLSVYGNPNGPTFGWLVKHALSRGETLDDAYRSIIHEATVTNSDVNHKYGLESSSSASFE